MTPFPPFNDNFFNRNKHPSSTLMTLQTRLVKCISEPNVLLGFYQNTSISKTITPEKKSATPRQNKVRHTSSKKVGSIQKKWRRFKKRKHNLRPYHRLLSKEKTS
jgi:hypothetical protein